MSDYRARFDFDLVRNLCRLQVVRRWNSESTEVLMADGTWQVVVEGTIPAEPVGVPIPAEAVEAIHEAATKHLGGSLASVGEIKTLREVLAKEQERVDTLFNATVHRVQGGML